MGTFRYTVSLILGIGLTYALQRWDRGRLSPEQRAAAWNGATWGAALYAFGPLSMLGWVWVTRQRFPVWRRGGVGDAAARSLLLVLAGLATAALIGAAIVGVDWVIGTLAGVE